MNKLTREQIEYYAKLELARRDFFYYCKLTAPDFYKENRDYLVYMCNELQNFLESDEDLCVINLPPRHGKSRTAGKLAEWIFGNNQTMKIMTGSYNETLSTVFSKGVRNTIQEIKAHEDTIVYSDIFPEVRIKQGDGAMNLWSLEGGYNNYLATSPTGTSTGFGANVLMIDDLIKNSSEAFNDLILEKHWEWFTNTMFSRLEENAKIIIIMTRWSDNDLAGRALSHFKNEHKKIRHIIMKAKQDDGTMLCDDILSIESYEMKTRAMDPAIASANYQQIPINIKGKLYSSFKTYSKIDFDFEGIYSYTDTADEGDDYLCTIIFGLYQKEAYVLDVYYTKAPMEKTEPEVARRLFDHRATHAYIESNNGGRGFARQVETHLEITYQTNGTVIIWFHQSHNKKARILSNASWIMEHVYFPINWRDRWPDYFKAMNEYQREGKNIHDDAPDATTGIAEIITGKISGSRKNYSGKGRRI